LETFYLFIIAFDCNGRKGDKCCFELISFSSVLSYKLYKTSAVYVLWTS